MLTGLEVKGLTPANSRQPQRVIERSDKVILKPITSLNQTAGNANE